MHVDSALKNYLCLRFEENDKLPEIKQPLKWIKEKKLKMLNYLVKKRFHSSNKLHEGPSLFLNRPLNKLLNVQNHQVFYARKKSFFFTLRSMFLTRIRQFRQSHKQLQPRPRLLHMHSTKMLP